MECRARKSRCHQSERSWSSRTAMHCRPSETVTGLLVTRNRLSMHLCIPHRPPVPRQSSSDPAPVLLLSPSDPRPCAHKTCSIGCIDGCEDQKSRASGAAASAAWAAAVSSSRGSSSSSSSKQQRSNEYSRCRHPGLSLLTKINARLAPTFIFRPWPARRYPFIPDKICAILRLRPIHYPIVLWKTEDCHLWVTAS